MQPATPQPLSREITMSSTTVSSSTSMVEPTEQSFKRKRESIRRALFTGGEQSGVDHISDTDPREFDEAPIKLLKKKASQLLENRMLFSKHSDTKPTLNLNLFVTVSSASARSLSSLFSLLSPTPALTAAAAPVKHKHYRPAGNKKEGNAARYVTRSQDVKQLQVSLPVFRKLCILKGVFPREPKKKVKGNHHTYYHLKDAFFIQHEPLLERLREIRAYERKVKKADAKKNKERAALLKERRPTYKLDRISLQRYPKFVDALRDIDDCLTMVHLFAALPAIEEAARSSKKSNANEKNVSVCHPASARKRKAASSNESEVLDDSVEDKPSVDGVVDDIQAMDDTNVGAIVLVADDTNVGANVLATDDIDFGVDTEVTEPFPGGLTDTSSL
ncbi:uncharacterized protein [Malus domestica]|uniref:uncharacterized protein n=1 Tax=Malus domestica TaxID=3750 RepID=UPI003974DA84